MEEEIEVEELVVCVPGLKDSWTKLRLEDRVGVVEPVCVLEPVDCSAELRLENKVGAVEPVCVSEPVDC